MLRALQMDMSALLSSFEEMGLRLNRDMPEESLALTNFFFRRAAPAQEAKVSARPNAACCSLRSNPFLEAVLAIVLSPGFIHQRLLTRVRVPWSRAGRVREVAAGARGGAEARGRRGQGPAQEPGESARVPTAGQPA